MKLTGIVTNSNVYKDNDLIVDLLTKEGLFVFRSKGIKKIDAKNKSLIFDFSHIEAEFIQKSTRNILINGQNLTNTSFLYSNYEGLVFINVLKEVLYKIVLEEDRHLIFDDLERALKLIEKDSKHIYKTLIALITKLLRIAGYDPVIYFENSGIDEVLNNFVLFDFERDNFDSKQDLVLIKKLLYFIEEVVDIKINSIELI